MRLNDALTPRTARVTGIPARSIELLVDASSLEKRRQAIDARGADAWRPNRDRKVSAALQAYAYMATSAARGAVRDVTQIAPKR